MSIRLRTPQTHQSYELNSSFGWVRVCQGSLINVPAAKGDNKETRPPGG